MWFQLLGITAHWDKITRVLCAAWICKHDIYLSLNKMFTVDTDDICVYLIIKWNKNKNRSVRLSYVDLKYQFMSC